MSKKKNPKRINTYFRQTAKAFRVARQTQIFSHINKNLPYRIYTYSKVQFTNNFPKLFNQFGKIKMKLPSRILITKFKIQKKDKFKKSQ